MSLVLRTLVVDDEPLAREGLADYIQQIDFLELTASLGNPLQAIDYLERNEIDLLLLDIEMPQLSGLELLESLRHPPLVILTTAYPNYALDGFRLEVLDYLLKPTTFQRFLQAALRARRRREEKQTDQAPTASTPPPEGDQLGHFFIKTDGKIERIQWQELRFAEAMQNYIQIHTQQSRYLTLFSLRELAAQAPDDRFVRVHKSYLANLNHVEALEGRQLRIGDKLIPVSRSKWNEIQDRILGDRLLE